MVVMITPVAFATIQYKTYIIFAVINAFIVPVTYFFYVSRELHPFHAPSESMLTSSSA